MHSLSPFLQMHSLSPFLRFCSFNVSPSLLIPSLAYDSSKIVKNIDYLLKAFNLFYTSVFTFNLLNGQLSFLPNHYMPLLSDLHITSFDFLSAVYKLKPKFNNPVGIPALFSKLLSGFLFFSSQPSLTSH